MRPFQKQIEILKFSVYIMFPIITIGVFTGADLRQLPCSLDGLGIDSYENLFTNLPRTRKELDLAVEQMEQRANPK